MTAPLKMLIIFCIFFLSSFLFIQSSYAQTALPINSLTDFSRDVTLGMNQISNDAAASEVQNNIAQNQIIGGKISTSTGVDVVEIIQSLDLSNPNLGTVSIIVTPQISENKIQLNQIIQASPTGQITY